MPRPTGLVSLVRQGLAAAGDPRTRPTGMGSLLTKTESSVARSANDRGQCIVNVFRTGRLLVGLREITETRPADKGRTNCAVGCGAVTRVGPVHVATGAEPVLNRRSVTM